MEWFNQLIDLFSQTITLLDQWRYITPDVALWILLIVPTFLAYFIIALWLKNYEDRVGRTAVVSVSLALPVIFAVLLHIPMWFKGNPDDHCDKYDNGNLLFILKNFTVVPQNPALPFGDRWLILTVLAPDRFGNEIHVCRLALSNPKAENIRKQVVAQENTGVVTFTFNGGVEKPNFQFGREDPNWEKDVPPEVPIERAPVQ